MVGLPYSSLRYFERIDLLKPKKEALTTEELFEHMSEFGNITVNDALLRKTLEFTGETFLLHHTMTMKV